MKNKLLSSPSIHVEIPKLSLNEELPEKPPNLDAGKYGKFHCVIM